MKRLNHFFAFLFLLLFSGNTFAQTNSVLLKDAGNMLISAHNSISSAYAAIPATLTQPYIIEIDSSYRGADEKFPIVFTEKAGASSTNVIAIRQSVNAMFIGIGGDIDTVSIFVFDGADWIILGGTIYPAWNSGIILAYTKPHPQKPMIQFINGATNNVVKNLNFLSTSTDDSFRIAGIGFGGTTTSEGNSNNTVTACTFMGMAKGIISEGLINHPNSNINITRNFMDVYAGGFIAESGTGKLFIQDNTVTQWQVYDISDAAPVVLDSLSDTALISRNHLQIVATPGTKGKDVSCIEIKNPYGSNHLVSVVNNVIGCLNNTAYKDTGTVIYPDSATTLSGIRFAGNTAIHADVYYNTIQVRGMNAAGKQGDVQSAALRKLNGNGGAFNIKNNLFINSRKNIAPGHHTAIAIEDTSGTLDIDYNTYNAATGEIAMFGNIVYGNLASYRSVSLAREQHSNDMVVVFVDDNVALSAGMINNPGLKGIHISTVGNDKDGDLRTYPYRGADELTVSCSGIPPKGAISNSYPSSCAKDSVYVSLSYNYYPGINVNGHVYQWQYKPLGAKIPFMDIAGANKLFVILKINESMEFRMVDSCIGGGTQYSDIDTIIYTPAPYADSIIAMQAGIRTYGFSAAGAKNIVDYKWYFGDGDSSDLANPQHTFADDNSYQVRLKYSNDCGSGNKYHWIMGGTAIENITSPVLKVYPNPVSGMLIVEGAESGSTISIIDLTGTKLYQTTNTGNKTTLQASFLQKGVYLLQITDAKGNRVGKTIIKE